MNDGKIKVEKLYKIDIRIAEKKVLKERKPKTEWDDYYSQQFGSDIPLSKRFTYKRRIFIFKCPYCYKQRQLIEQDNLICGAVNCKCGSKFRVIRNHDTCASCKFKMKCLAEGLVLIKREKEADPLYDTTPEQV